MRCRPQGGHAWPTRQNTAHAALREAGHALAQEAGIRIAGRSAPLWRPPVLADPVSARISAGTARAEQVRTSAT
ncbi:MAG: hypothetical protein M0026_17630 [Nocardiopsaceae bacterium]|nr:hypothetical protein [Nocardiopsaceae bacterium]